MSVSKRLRYEILRRDGHTCRYCGASAPDVTITVDHVIPIALGGTDEPTNLVAACVDCNAGKTSTPADASQVTDVARDALRWSRAIGRAARERAAQWEPVDAICDWFVNEWPSDYYPSASNWRQSVATFIAAGLGQSDLGHFIRVVEGRGFGGEDLWKYFCGCCWHEINNRRKRAVEILNEEQSFADLLGVEP